MRRRSAAITMNVLDRVMALYLEDMAVPRVRDCEDVVTTHFDAIERFAEAAIRYGQIFVPEPSWNRNRERYEDFRTYLNQFFGLGTVLVPKALASGQDYQRHAVESLVQAGQRQELQRVLGKTRDWGVWSEFVLRESQLYAYPLSKDVREADEFGPRYVDDDTFRQLRPYMPAVLLDHLVPRVGTGPGARRRTELYVVSSVVRGHESDIILSNADGVDYFVFRLHSSLGEIPARVESGGEVLLTKGFGPIEKLLSSFFAYILYCTLPGRDAPAQLLRLLGALVSDKNVEHLRHLLDEADQDPSILASVGDFVNFGKTDNTGVDKAISAIADNIAALAVGGAFLLSAAAVRSISVFLGTREKVLSRRIGTFVERERFLRKEEQFDAAAAKRRFREIFAHRFGE